MKTIEELEREAYITGDVKTASFYAQIDDLQRQVDSLEEELENTNE